MKRQRGRNRRNNNNNNNSNRSMDSNGPDVKVRGNAGQIYEKYVALARDAASSGNRVKAENYRQHAEHYLRLVNAMEAAKQAAREEAEAAKAANSSDDEGDEDQNGEGRKGRRYPPRVRKSKDSRNEEKNDGANESSGLEVVTPEASDVASSAETGADDSAEAKPVRRRKAPARKKDVPGDAAE